MEAFDVEMSMRRDVYDKIVAFKINSGTEFENLSAEVKRFVEKAIFDGKRNGKFKPRYSTVW